MSAKKFYETAEFKKLQKEWAKKLADSGFEDIEKNEDEHIVRPQEFTLPANVKPDSMEYTEFVELAGGLDHYEFCQAVLREFNFTREIDRCIFELYAEGKTEREIQEMLPSLGHRAISNVAIHKIIHKIREQFRKG